MITLKTMTIDDYETVMALWTETEGLCLTAADSLAGIQSFLTRNPNLSVVAWDDKTVAGAVLCGHDGRRGYLHHMAVAKAYRDRGIATRMMEQCLAALGQLGILDCKIFKLSSNSGAETFWLKKGWTLRDNLQVMQKATPRDAASSA
ncbi:MAG: GNAT family N-acetyltransferase [Verrucomicrobia bacterium]|nr:GNAT family N-acetyltransferase [Verrucomicrobiota bacterium]